MQQFLGEANFDINGELRLEECPDGYHVVGRGIREYVYDVDCGHQAMAVIRRDIERLKDKTLFTGMVPGTIDEDGFVAIPDCYRDAFPEWVCIYKRDNEQRLQLFPDALWDGAGTAVRMIMEAGRSSYVRFNPADGRFKIRERLRDPLRLDRDIVWAGARQVLSIYSRETWDALQRTDG